MPLQQVRSVLETLYQHERVHALSRITQADTMPDMVRASCRRRWSVGLLLLLPCLCVITIII
jgi:hypothetical protein